MYCASSVWHAGWALLCQRVGIQHYSGGLNSVRGATQRRHSDRESSAYCSGEAVTGREPRVRAVTLIRPARRRPSRLCGHSWLEVSMSQPSQQPNLSQDETPTQRIPRVKLPAPQSSRQEKADPGAAVPPAVKAEKADAQREHGKNKPD